MVGPPNGRTDGAMHPARLAQTEDKLEARHVVWRFETNLSLDELRDVEGNQVRHSEHRAPREMVERYAEQMKNGATFPAIVVNEYYELVDGNTRWAAAKQNKRTSLPAYVCENLTSLQARSLSVELNQSHGLSMSPDEIRAFVESAADAGQKINTQAYARMTGTKPRTLARWIAAHGFRARAAREGFPAEAIAQLRESVQVALNAARLKAVFTEATRLAIDARINAQVVQTIIRDANNALSETAALEVIASARATRAEDIKNLAAGFQPAKRKSLGPEAFIGGLLKFEPADLVDVAPERQQDALARMRTLHERLGLAIEQAAVAWSGNSNGTGAS
jgi:ParB-like chromosome segregation protein Spo0J